MFLLIDKPYFHDFNGYADVKQNQSFNLTLEASAYPMPITYTWFNPSGRQLFTDQTRIFINQGQLSIITVQKIDLGVYRCVATNPYGNSEVNFTLNVLCMKKFFRQKKKTTFFLFFIDGPVITRTRGYSIYDAVSPGSSVTLLCAIDANPIDLNTIRWFKNNQSIINDGQWERRIEGNEASLIGKYIRKIDAGQYACEIENSYGNSRATIPLIVQCKILIYIFFLYKGFV